MPNSVKIAQKTIKMKQAEYFGYVRDYLSRHFPGCQFSLSVKRYARGKSLRVTWTDGPSTEALNGLQELYNGAEIGPSRMKSKIDTIVTKPLEIVNMNYGFDFILLNRKIST